MPPPERLHALFLEVAKAIGTYRLSYRAAFRYGMAKAVPKIAHPLLVAFTRKDRVFPLFERAAALNPRAERAEMPGFETPAACAETAAILRRFLDAP